MSSALSWIFSAAAVICGGLLLQYVTKIAKSFWSLRNFEGPKPPSFLIGHFAKDMTLNSTAQIYRQWGNDHSPVFKVRVGFLRTSLVFCHPDSVKLLLQRNDPKENWVYPMLDPWLGGSILVTHGKRWQRSRKLLTPAFHLDILRSYVKVYNECTTQLINRWSSPEGKIVEIYGDMKRLTFDILMRCIFSIDTQCLKDGREHPYLHAVEELGRILVERANSALLTMPPIFELVYGRKFRKNCDLVHQYSSMVISERKAQLAREKEQNNNGTVSWESGRKKIDFIDILLTSMHEDGSPVKDEEIQPEVDMFMFAGHDTTSSGLSWALYHLASRQDLQQRCREEVQQVLRESGEVNYADLNNLTYLTQCIKESLRMCPPVPFIGRELTEPLELLDGRVVPAGTTVYCAITLLHYNASVWSNPEVYDPSRFDSDQTCNRAPHAHVPFSSGARNCIGQMFAMNVMKVTLALLLSKYTFAIDVTRDVNFMHDIIIRPRNGLHLLVRPLHNE